MVKLYKEFQLFGGIFDGSNKKKRINELEKKTTDPGFWDDNEKAQTVLKELNDLKEWINNWEELNSKNNDLLVLFDLAQEENDEKTLQEVSDSIQALQSDIVNLELRQMLNGEDDNKNAIVTIHPGAGGTESQDWADMLFRMYIRYAQRKGFITDILNISDGDEAGIKSAIMEIRGDYSYGYLKAEAGVHRLVRISPFDSNKRRHTSFASVFVYPEVDEDIEVDINPSDLRVDTYRASGAGGQHVNKTSSAVRITHLPTGIVVQCQNERSQHKNKANAMKVLNARLYQQKKEEEQKKIQDIEEKKKEIAWGHQIRSYVFHPYNKVKDHRTDVETSNTQNVMDGELDEFIKAYLLRFSN
ncbi:MAG: peptide chain release factor 2 [bacterium]